MRMLKLEPWVVEEKSSRHSDRRGGGMALLRRSTWDADNSPEKFWRWRNDKDKLYEGSGGDKLVVTIYQF